eukprot:s2839_g7.t1
MHGHFSLPSSCEDPSGAPRSASKGAKVAKALKNVMTGTDPTSRMELILLLLILLLLKNPEIKPFISRVREFWPIFKEESGSVESEAQTADCQSEAGSMD